MTENKKLGDLLKEAGLIDDFQLQSALSHQRNWGGKLGSILIELEFIGEEDLARFIAEKVRIPYVNLFEPEITEAVIRMIKADVAKKYHVVPVRKEGGALVLAMFDPLDIKAIDEIRFITGLTIKPALSMESEISNAIRKYYDGEEVVHRPGKTLFHQATESHGKKMEIIHGSDLMMSKAEESEAPSTLMSKEEITQQTQTDYKVRLDALITVLIEKKLITREELISMVYQKKMGL